MQNDNDNNNMKRTSHIVNGLVFLLAYSLAHTIQAFFFEDSTYPVMVLRLFITCAIILASIVMRFILVLIRRSGIKSDRRLDGIERAFSARKKAKENGLSFPTPLDFCYFVIANDYFFPINILNGRLSRPRPLDCAELISDAVDNFEKLFGRKPELDKSNDWIAISVAEMFRGEKNLPDEIQFSEFRSRICEDVIQATKECSSTWLDTLSEFFPQYSKLVLTDLKKKIS